MLYSNGLLLKEALLCPSLNSIMVFLFSVVNEFGRIAIEFLRKGTNPKVYEGAASKYVFWL